MWLTGIIADRHAVYASRLLPLFLLSRTVTGGHQRGGRRAMGRQPRRHLVGPRRVGGARGVCDDLARGLLMQRGTSTRAGPGDGHAARQAACCPMPFGQVDMDMVARLCPKLLRGRRVACHRREAAPAMALDAALACRACQPSEAAGQGRPAIIQWQEGRPPTRHAHRVLLGRKHGGAWRRWPHWRIMPIGALRPLDHRLRPADVALGARMHALLMRLHRLTHGRGGAGAPVESWSHQASRDGKSAYTTPAARGPKHLERFTHAQGAEASPHGLFGTRAAPPPTLSQRANHSPHLLLWAGG
jgi:hypothetical protein